MLSILTVLAVLCIIFALAWRFDDTIMGTAPIVLCAMGLVLYLLAFVGRLSWIDGILLAGGLASLGAVFYAVRVNGAAALTAQLRRLFADSYLWVCIAIVLVMCFFLQGEQILEWDGYNFWAPDTKGLYYQDGFAPKHSNVSLEFGDYTPFAQLIWWWFLHLSGAYSEQQLFMGYYIFGALLLFSIAEGFVRGNGLRRTLTAAIAGICAIILPGVACTAWFRALCVDPLMAMLFGLALSLIVCRNEAHSGFWKAKICIVLLALTLVKSIGIMWSILALLFFCLWWLKERREFGFAGICALGIALCYGSWSIFCKVMERSTYLVNGFSSVASDRISELQSGTFLTAGNNQGYLDSYAQGFLSTPIHREATFAIDLSPAALLLILFSAVLLLWKFGFVPRKKLGRLLGFMTGTLVLIYVVLLIGQLTMFYYETQYLDPVRAVTLMTRYCAPANMGLLILACTFASGRASGAAPEVLEMSRRSLIAFALVAGLILSCGAYAEMGRRFVHDPLDESREAKRALFLEEYSGVLADIQAVPWWEAEQRILLCVYGREESPIVMNEAAPVPLFFLSLSGVAYQDLALIEEAMEKGQPGYLYVDACTEEVSAALSAYVAGGAEFNVGSLYEIQYDQDGQMQLGRVIAAK